MTGKPYEPLRRQCYRLRGGVNREDFVICPDWVKKDGVYEGDIDHSSLDYPDLQIRLQHPTDPDLSFLVEEVYLDEVG